MLRLRKYLKRFWWVLLCLVALLYAQAQCELALPDYMSNIVSTGIQAGGIESDVPKIISMDTFDKTLIFMNDKDREFVTSKYVYRNGDEIINNDLPYAIDAEFLKEKGIYVLENVSDKDMLKLEKTFSIPLLVQAQMNGIENGTTKVDDKTKAMLAQLPPGMSVFDAFKMMPENQLKEFTGGIEKKMSTMGESAIRIAASQGVKEEYKMLGVDTGAIQINYIMFAGMQMLVIALGGALCAVIVGYCASRTAAGVARNMRSDVFNKVEGFSNQEMNKFSTASLITRTTNDIQQIQMALVMVFRVVIYSPILAIGAIIRVINAEATMILIIAATIILIMVIMAIMFSVVSPEFRRKQKLVDRLNLVMRESLSGMLVIRAFQTEKVEEAKFDVANQEMLKVNLFTNRAMVLMMPIVMFIMNCVALVIVWVGSHQIDLGTMQIGDMMAFMQYAMLIIMSFMMVAMISVMISRAGAATKRVFEVLDVDLSIADPITPLTFEESGKGSLSFKNVCFRYPGAEEDVLSNISFEALPGQTTAIIGSTGSGKSTIVNLVPRFFDVSKGSIEVNGVDVRKVTQHDLRDKIGLVPQKGVLFAGTIESNIKYGDENMNDEQMVEASRVAQAIEFIETKEEKYDTHISQGGSNVSGGQKQRLSIARAVAKNPDIYIFDDSFSALDFKTDALVREAINKVCEKTQSTILLVAQRVSSIMHADQIIVLDDGRLVGKGTHKQLMSKCEVYQEIAHSQLSKEELENE